MSSQSRHVYTRNERRILEDSFARQSHPDINEKERLAQLLNCNIIQISNWFQNHRRRIKKQSKPISTTVNSSIYHQPTCPFNVNNNNSSYYYYPTPSQYVYSHDPNYTQTIYFDPYITYEQ